MGVDVCTDANEDSQPAGGSRAAGTTDERGITSTGRRYDDIRRQTLSSSIFKASRALDSGSALHFYH
ncbi:hypothetical protein HETIRDRAFT_449732 [Heterobasidion irregulare TC 32-1]|uniref:Uncharacterized protein n=1 Tax=Heterobasidion irregulare (strain TC 32-1) TaxID=747525 RepID=W4KEK8_HETIT|nr:uncharacterized protein HETIRDRAFT_449732 [Heterobasidion irregulare TC 32-1]ETW84179.1 hypothetical protein HETIRDRAFT_449732 [Heterobasidion irregulare TC 32-1]